MNVFVFLLSHAPTRREVFRSDLDFVRRGVVVGFRVNFSIFRFFT